MTGPVLMLLLASASSFFFKSPYPAATATSGACMARHPNGRSRAVLMPYANDQQGDGIASSTNESPIRAAVVTDKAKADSEGSRSKQSQNVTLLQALRPGMRLHGGVVGVTEFAAFLDVKVVREGPGGKLVRCNAMLHPHDVPEGIKLLRDSHNQPLPLETDPSVIRRGIHVSVYVKDVFPNSGRFSVTLDPFIDKAKVIAARKQKRLLGKKRNKVRKLEGVEEGAEKHARVVKLLRTALLLDIGMPVPAFLPHSYVPDTVPLESIRHLGALLRVRIKERTDRQIKCEMIEVEPPSDCCSETKV
ncbi:hypothetical protein NSK_003531 [Nannochloropsis salina CCMP1776]|uniref:S1 motif domain-containing protein n=1 Tax=Nannochloropsis salina CCMP1776 TaxID=1027361 RepID=A0A4D9D8Z1_9STRA|nr:hypothetical protein NSK_003531 [Nannochloropsis salina CCMP1776]|eukprot:TFJ85108.1 hypothetical protein NSK_003531 [Nannochloropsis salina CCMP1776]